MDPEEIQDYQRFLQQQRLLRSETSKKKTSKASAQTDETIDYTMASKSKPVHGSDCCCTDCCQMHGQGCLCTGCQRRCPPDPPETPELEDTRLGDEDSHDNEDNSEHKDEPELTEE